jgi:hypothetical protein
MGDHRLGDGLHLAGVQVGGDLQEQRDGARRGQGLARLGDPAEQLFQRRLGLQGAEARRVRRGDVDGEIGGQPPQPFQPGHVVADAVGGVLVGPDVGPHHARSAPGEPVGERLQALVVEAHAVDHRAVLGEPEQPRPRIARLRQGRDRAALHEAEAGPEHGGEHLGVLVEAGRQAHHVRHGYTAQRAAENGVVGPGQRAEPRLEAEHRQAVGVLGVEAAQRPRGEAVQEAQGNSPISGIPSGSSGASATPRTRPTSSAP